MDVRLACHRHAHGRELSVHETRIDAQRVREVVVTFEGDGAQLFLLRPVREEDLERGNALKRFVVHALQRDAPLIASAVSLTRRSPAANSRTRFARTTRSIGTISMPQRWIRSCSLIMTV